MEWISGELKVQTLQINCQCPYEVYKFVKTNAVMVGEYLTHEVFLLPRKLKRYNIDLYTIINENRERDHELWELRAILKDAHDNGYHYVLVRFL